MNAHALLADRCAFAAPVEEHLHGVQAQRLALAVDEQRVVVARRPLIKPRPEKLTQGRGTGYGPHASALALPDHKRVVFQVQVGGVQLQKPRAADAGQEEGVDDRPVAGRQVPVVGMAVSVEQTAHLVIGEERRQCRPGLRETDAIKGVAIDGLLEEAPGTAASPRRIAWCLLLLIRDVRSRFERATRKLLVTSEQPLFTDCAESGS